MNRRHVSPGQTLIVGRYARISDDSEELELGVNRQLSLGERRLEYEGYQDAERTYVDNDKSAFQRNVVREAFEDLLADFIAGKIDGMWGYDLDRFWRQPRDLERVIDAYEEAKRKGRPRIFLTEQGAVDLSTDDGITMARIMVAVANKASRDTSRRVAAQKLERAMSGDSTSNFPAFGWNADGTLNDKAELRRGAIHDVIAGISPTAIADRWRKQGVLTERGKEWRSSAVRRIVLAPRNAGFAVYREEILLGKDGQPIKGTWQPLVDEATWRDARAAILNKAKRSEHRTKSLLSSIARCGKCGMGMVRNKRANGRYSYACRSADSGGCAGVSINGNRLDAQVADLVQAYLKGKKVESKVEPFHGSARLEEISTKIGELMAEYRAGLPGSIVFPSIRELEDEQRELLAEQSKHSGQQRRKAVVSSAWPENDVDKQRAILRQLFEAIVIAPGGKTGFYDEDRVDPIWREP